jgi:hypothetical protein
LHAGWYITGTAIRIRVLSFSLRDECLDQGAK